MTSKYLYKSAEVKEGMAAGKIGYIYRYDNDSRKYVLDFGGGWIGYYTFSELIFIDD